MKKITILFFFLLTGVLSAQDEGTIQGFVLDKEVNNEPLPFVTVSVKNTQINTNTDLDGSHTLKVNAGTYTLVFNFPGYQKVEVPNVTVTEDQVTKVKDVVLSAMQFSFSQHTNEKEPTSSDTKK